MNYKIDFSRWSPGDPVTVIGCGGNGGFVAEGLCRILSASHPISLVDFDRVEERNLVRQNFYREELGSFKSEALAKRLSRKFGRPIAYSVNPFSLVNSFLMGGSNLIIGCVDNGPARQAIADAMESSWGSWWIDAGNGDSWGQILIGNTCHPQTLEKSFDPKSGVCRGLPLPSIQLPHILEGSPAPSVSCAEAVERDEQDPVINQAMAMLTVDAVRKLITGTCSFMQIYLDLKNSTLKTVPVTPGNVAAVTGLTIKNLIERRPK